VATLNLQRSMQQVYMYMDSVGDCIVVFVTKARIPLPELTARVNSPS